MEFARRGMRTIMACRDGKSADEAAQEAREITGAMEIIGVECNLASFESIRNFAKQIHATEPRIDILVNNAAIFQCPFALTEDGLEMQMGVNYLGHFLLTNLLLPKMDGGMFGHHSKIIITSSPFHTRGQIDIDNLVMNEANYNKYQAFCNSKLACNLFAIELSRRTQPYGIDVHCVEPLFSKTYMHRHVDLSILDRIKKTLLAKPSIDGVQSTLQCAGAPEVEGKSGLYYRNCHVAPWSQTTLQHSALAPRLWKVSKELTGLKTTI